MEGRCQCGAIRFTTPTQTPSVIYICHCTECRAQSSSTYGLTAIFPMFDIPNPKPGSNIDEHIGIHLRPSPTDVSKNLECLFCRKCGVRLMHRIPGQPSLSMKAGCLKGLDKKMMRGAEHIWARSAIIDIPDTLPDGTKVTIWDEEPEGGSFRKDDS